MIAIDSSYFTSVNAKTQTVAWLIILPIVIPIVSHMMIRDYNYWKKLELSGVVELIEWNPPLNHGLPRFTFRLDNGKTVEISHANIRLSKDDIAIGDKVLKESGSAYCLINEISIRCTAPEISRK